MVKKYFFLASAAALLIGCGGSSNNADNAVATPPPQPPLPPPTPHPTYTQTPLDLNYSTALWHVDFENLPDGKIKSNDLCRLRLNMYCGITDEVDHTGHLNVRRVRDLYTSYSTVDFLGSKALRIEIDPAKMREASPAMHVMNFFEQYEQLGADYQELYHSYRIYYPTDFDEGLGFKTLGGLVANLDGMRYPTGYGPIGEDAGFAARAMIRPNTFTGPGTSRVQNVGPDMMRTYHYVMHQDLKSHDGYSDRIGYTDFWSYKKGLPQGYLVETRVKMNTPGVHNGEIETTINGVRIGFLNNLMFAKSGGYGIRTAHNFMHYGGDHTWNPLRSTYVIIDDLAVTLKSVHEK